LEKILAIELFNAAQAMDFRKPMQTSPMIEKILKAYRQQVDFIEMMLQCMIKFIKVLLFYSRLNDFQFE
jgi:histidine ammonia-lyase